MARTKKVYAPSPLLALLLCGLVQASQAPALLRHSNVAAGLSLWNVKVAVELVNRGGAVSMKVSGTAGGVPVPSVRRA